MRHLQLAEELVSADVQCSEDHGIRLHGLHSALVRFELLLFVQKIHPVDEQKFRTEKTDADIVALTDVQRLARQLHVRHEARLVAVERLHRIVAFRFVMVQQRLLRLTAFIENPDDLLVRPDIHFSSRAVQRQQRPVLNRVQTLLVDRHYRGYAERARQNRRVARTAAAARQKRRHAIRIHAGRRARRQIVRNHNPMFRLHAIGRRKQRRVNDFANQIAQDAFADVPYVRRTFAKILVLQLVHLLAERVDRRRKRLLDAAQLLLHDLPREIEKRGILHDHHIAVENLRMVRAKRLGKILADFLQLLLRHLHGTAQFLQLRRDL